ncbi:GNAT family N-acetyltransferase [uncultured Chryseobacterium sp.]|uniref:GNAT family N-acetyltransferase n=1 Tax=uncultured Chryseobacterium sp. TaxID=259322 RepID=UPI002607CC64|nr:GNAT family N-acetyltransferase [uncultured Chryseobacterium sp.]
MHSFEIIESDNPKWKEIIKKTDTFDFHHTAYFHKIDTHFPAQLLYFSKDQDFIALPVVIRPIDGSPYYDITSVYGYAGPIFHFSSEEAKNDLISYFKTSFIDYCKEQKIISVFARLHPLIDQKNILQGLGDIVNLNKTVSIDLTLHPEEQRREYRKSLKSELNQLRRKEIFVESTTHPAYINDFIAIYYETMDRVNASANYYFSKEYFYEFLNNDDFDAELLIAKKDNKVIAGAIFTFTDKIMQYHLAGTTEEFIKETPMKLILDHARLLGNESSAKDLHLGGGVGGSDDDSLFKFKSGFSKNFKQFSVWKYIVNTDVYHELSKEKTKSEFFPLYRS